MPFWWFALAARQWHPIPEGVKMPSNLLALQEWRHYIAGMARHRKLVKHFHEPGHLHEFTFSCYLRRPLLTNDCWRQYLADSIRTAGEQFNVQLIAFVFMPEHVHLLTLPLDAEPAIAGYLAAVKRPTSELVKSDLQRRSSRLLEQLTIWERPGKTAFRFWQEGPGYDRNLFDESAILKAIDYIHANPARRGLCREAADWGWSSARWFASDGQVVDPRHPPLTRLPMEFGWRIG
jgi:putative transposase